METFLKLSKDPLLIKFFRTKLISWILSLFLPWLEENDFLPNTNEVKYIFLISCGATDDRLTRMSYNTTVLALRLSALFPKAPIVLCDFRYNSEKFDELKAKVKILPKGRVIYAGFASSTTDERESLVKACRGNSIKNSIIVSNGAHTKRARIVWEHYHPNENLCFRSTKAKEDNDPESPMIAQRIWQIWVFVNLIGILLYKIFGVEYFARTNPHQPVEYK